MLGPDYRPMVFEKVSRARRELGRQSPAQFAQIYLPHHFHRPMSRMHREVFDMLSDISSNRPRRLAIAAPRGHAKSTLVSLAYALWCAVYGSEQFILIISATKELAISQLKNLKDQLQGNPLLLQDFPDSCHAPGAKPAPKPWRDNQIVLRNGVAIKALGAGQGIRGMKHGRHRPSLVIIDDLEDQEHVVSSDQRTKLRDWFEKTLLKTGQPDTNFILIGTVLHYDSLLACHVSSANAGSPSKISGWETRLYQAVESWSSQPQLWEKWESIYTGQDFHQDKTGPAAANQFYLENQSAMLEGTAVLWPELEDYEQLMITRVREGRLSFQSEKQNEPLDPKECIFREESFRYWDKEFKDVAELVGKIGSYGRIFGACDPSLGKRGGKGDYTAIITLLQDTRDKLLYVIGAEIVHRRPDQIIEQILQFARMYKYREFRVEDNQFQELLINQLKDRLRSANVRLELKPITSTAHKPARIESLEPLINQGTLRFSRRQQLLIEQLRQFPLSAHDDGPDALQMAVQAAQKPEMYVSVERY